MQTRHIHLKHVSDVRSAFQFQSSSIEHKLVLDILIHYRPLYIVLDYLYSTTFIPQLDQMF